MRTIYRNIFIVLFALGTFASCESQLDDVVQQGTTSTEDFYKTDEDALEAVAAVYFQWRDMIYDDFFLKNLLSDDVYTGGGARGDNSAFEQVNEYRFSSSNTLVTGYFSSLYTLIYRSNLIINRIDADTDVKMRVLAESKVARAWAYTQLVSLWGPVPLVTGLLAPSEYQQPNAEVSAIYEQIETDLTEAIASGVLPEKTSMTDQTVGVRLTKQAAQAFLGKAYVYEGKYAEAATVLKEVINSNKYDLISNYNNVLRKVEDLGAENIFEVNSLNDGENAWTQQPLFFETMIGWRADKLNLYGYYYGSHDIYPSGWGFINPRKELYNAFVATEGTSGYRLGTTIKTYAQVNQMGAPYMAITINAGSSLYGHEGYFSWKVRYLGSELVDNSYGLVSDVNYRYMRYAEVVLLAAEACLESGDADNALLYINKIRARAQLGNLASVTQTDIKNEKRLELCLEGVRFQDLVRWGDAATALADQGKQVAIFSGFASNGSLNVTYPYTNTTYGFKTGKHELLPFPEHEMLVNQNLAQNPGW